MDELVELWEKPRAGRAMIAGWRQWADAGEISSGLPRYLINRTGATKIGEIRPGRFYLFQIPGTHHLLRPVVTLKDGYRQAMEERANEFFYAQQGRDGILLFLGEEPHQDEARYADAFLDAVEELGVRRVVAVAGVHGPVPYDKEREISCVYSLRSMREEMQGYAVRPSEYQGGATICTYVTHRAEERGIEMVVFYALAPAYDFSKGQVLVEQVSMGADYKAWYDVMRRINHMLRLDLDLGDLRQQSDALIASWRAKLDQLARAPHLDVREYMEQVNAEFTEHTFEPLSHVWGDALDHILDDTNDDPADRNGPADRGGPADDA